MVTQTFGDALFTPDSDYLKEFPSPESLKKRFIISTKPPKEYLQAKKVDGDEKNGSQKEKDVTDEGAWGKELSSHRYGTNQDKVRHILHIMLIAELYIASICWVTC